MKTGLIMEGGAMRGLFTAGIIDVFMENNITFDGAIGVSAGAAFGCNIKSKQIGRVLRYNKNYCNDERYCGFKTLIKTGDMYGADFCYHELPEKLDIFDNQTFLENPMEFYVVATDMETGQAVYHKCKDGKGYDLEWIRASASMPLVSRIVEIDEKKYLDGGIADSIPVKYFEEIGYDRNVVILTQPKDFVKGKNKLLPLMKLKLSKYPNFIKTMRNRHIIYNQTTAYIKEQEKQGKLFVIRPEERLEIKRVEHNPENIERAYQKGREVAKKKLEELKKFLKID